MPRTPCSTYRLQLHKDFTFDNGGLTFTLKLRRRVVEQQFHDVIERLYADVSEPRPILQD